MAKISIKIEGSTVGTIVVSDTLSQEHSDRFMGWLVANYGRDDTGKPRTPTDMIASCWASIRSGIFANIESHEREVASQAARDAVPSMVSETTIGE